MEEKEVTAYIQQQMMDLEPHLEGKTSLQVRLVDIGDEFEAEVTAFHPDGEIQTVGRNASLFDAIRFAKEGLIEYFLAVADEVNPLEREAKINHLSQHGNLYLH